MLIYQSEIQTLIPKRQKYQDKLQELSRIKKCNFFPQFKQKVTKLLYKDPLKT